MLAIIYDNPHFVRKVDPIRRGLRQSVIPMFVDF